MIQRALKIFLVLNFLISSAYAMVAGGRPNSISGGHNAFAGVVNPANAVWIKDRFDVGVFLVRQKSTFDNKDNNPRFNPGKINQTYKEEFYGTGDAAIHKRGVIHDYECSFSLATYTTPGYVRIRTKEPVPIIGDTPVRLINRTQSISSIFSLKFNEQHSIGFSVDYFYLTHLRNGFQNSDNSTRSVSPGHVTNKGKDYAQGTGLTLGWRWNITNSLTFGLAYIKKSSVGQFKRYRGFEPFYAKNYIPQSIGGGITYRFNPQLAGRLEVLWTNYGNLPNSNNSILPNGSLNPNKRGSNKSPGSGLQDATIINAGLGYKVNENLSFGSGFSHRIKLKRNSPYIISHSYLRQTIFNLATLGVNYNYHNHDFFFTLSHGFKNHQSGKMPDPLGGGRFASTKAFNSMSLAWGYLY